MTVRDASTHTPEGFVLVRGLAIILILHATIAAAQVAPIPTWPGTTVQVTPIQGANALSTPAARHIVQVDRPVFGPDGKATHWFQPILFMVVQRENIDGIRGTTPARPGLVMYRSDDMGNTWQFHATLNPSTTQRDTVDMVVHGQDLLLVYSFDGPTITPNATLDPQRKVFFQRWRHNGALEWKPDPRVEVFSPPAGTAYHRAQLAVDVAGRIWIQTFRREPTACDPAVSADCRFCRATIAGDNYANTLHVAVSTNGGASFQVQPTTFPTTPCRAGGRLLSLNDRLLLIWNDYSVNKGGTVPMTQFSTRHGADPLASWTAPQPAFPDLPVDGIYHGAAMSAVSEGVNNRAHLVYKDQNQQQLWYRSFNGTSFGPRVLVDSIQSDWALQPAITRHKDDLFIFDNHQVAPNTYELRLWQKSRGFGTYNVVDNSATFKGYPAALEVLPDDGRFLLTAFGQTPSANDAGDVKLSKFNRALWTSCTSDAVCLSGSYCARPMNSCVQAARDVRDLEINQSIPHTTNTGAFTPLSGTEKVLSDLEYKHLEFFLGPFSFTYPNANTSMKLEVRLMRSGNVVATKTYPYGSGHVFYHKLETYLSPSTHTFSYEVRTIVESGTPVTATVQASPAKIRTLVIRRP